MRPGEEALLCFVENGDRKGLIAWLQSLPPSDCHQLSLPLQKLFKRHAESELQGRLSGDTTDTDRALLTSRKDTAQAALFACCTAQEISKLGWQAVPEVSDLLEIVAAFEPAWLERWCQDRLEENPRRFDQVFALVQAGRVRRPQGPAWLRGILVRFSVLVNDLAASPVDALLADSELRDREIYELLRLDSSGEFSLAAYDKYAPEGRGWQDAYLALSEAGGLDRHRLLDTILDVLAGDPPAFQASWFSRLLRALAPTDAELVTRQERILDLLGCAIGSTVSAALGFVSGLEKGGDLDCEAMVLALKPVLAGRGKGSVKKALKLLNRAGKRQSSLHPAIALRATEALLHEASDVQSAALAVIEKFGDPGVPKLRRLVSNWGSSVAPSLRQRRDVWLRAPKQTLPAKREEQPLTSGPSPTIRCPSEPPLVISHPKNQQELRELIGVLLEHPESPGLLDSVLGAAARLGQPGPSAEVGGLVPLKRRAMKILQDVSPKPLRLAAARLAVAWAGGEAPSSTAATSSGCQAFLAVLVEEVIKLLLTNQRASLLSTPSHHVAWISPTTLVERARAGVRCNQQATSARDQVLSLLRLADTGRREALSGALKIPGEYGQALVHALGGEAKVGPTEALWAAAARARHGSEDDPLVIRAFPESGPGAGHGAKFTPRLRTSSFDYEGTLVTHRWIEVDVHPSVPEAVGSTNFSVLRNSCPRVSDRYQSATGQGGTDLASVRWLASASPVDLEGFFAEGVARLDINWHQAQWEVRAYLEPLADPLLPLGPMAHLLMAVGLAAKERGQRDLALDAFLACAEDGRLDPRALGASLAEWLSAQVLLPTRVAKALTSASRHSSAAAKGVRNVLLATCAGDPSQAPRGTAQWLELLYELLIDAGLSLTEAATAAHVDPAAARAYLTGFMGSGKAAKLAKKLASG